MFIILTDQYNGTDVLLRVDAVTLVRDTKKPPAPPPTVSYNGNPAIFGNAIPEPYSYDEDSNKGTEVRLIDGDRLYVKEKVHEVQKLMGIIPVAHPGDLSS